MGINYQTIKTKEDIINIINNSNLPVINVLLILDSIRNELSALCAELIKKEKDEIENMQAEK